jgi:hypothetical protein
MQRFHSRQMIGQGAMGVVYRAYDEDLKDQVALKTLLHLGPEQIYRLKEEFRSLAGIHHRNLVELYDLVVDDDECFFTMELVDGADFVAHVRGQEGAYADPPGERALAGPGLDRLRDAALQLTLGIFALHEKDKLHCDVKPSNILVNREGRVVLLDFGLVVALGRGGEHEMATAGLAGTPAYMAPEQFWGRHSRASDWYGLGLVLYEALTGRRPYDGPAALLAKQSGAPRALRSLGFDVPHHLDALISRLLHPEPRARPGATEILRQLEGSSSQSRQSIDATRTRDGAFVGRVRELAELGEGVARVRSGSPAIVLLEGASGIGKTELVRRFLEPLERDASAVVLRGRCHPQESVPYKAFDAVIDALSRVLLALPEEHVASLVPRHANALTRVFPVLGRVDALRKAPATSDEPEPHEVRRRAFAALRQLLGALAKHRTLVLSIDDLQWGDLDSAALLRELLAPPAPPTMLLLLSYRSEDRTSAPLVAALREEIAGLPRDWVNEMVLAALDAVATRELASRLLGGQAGAEADLGAIVSESDGSPFLVTQLVRHVAAGRATVQATDASPASRLAAVLGERIERLSLPACGILETVSVAGYPLERGIALEAAGVRSLGRVTVTHLEREGLVRETTVGGQPAVEVFHDRIRELVVERLDAETVRQRHGNIAETLEGKPDADPEALFRHLVGAGQGERAADYAVRAADRAAEMLAFSRAAALYKRALELKPYEEARAVELQIAQADALANAGRCAEAAPLHVQAAQSRGGQRSLDLRRRAAEEYLVSGHIDEGTAALRALASDVGLRFPATSRQAMLSIVKRLAVLKLRGVSFRDQPRRRPSEKALTRIDVCYSAGKGLLMVDPPRGAHFALLGLWLALRSGDVPRIARSLCMVGCTVVPAGGAITRWGLGLLRAARKIAEQRGDPYLIGIAQVTLGQANIFLGDWYEALRLSDAGTDVLGDRCQGVDWERNIGHMGAMRALEELGELAEETRRAERLLRDAQDLGDIYAQVTAGLYVAYGRIAADDTAGARFQAQRAIASWSRSEFHVQHLYALRVDAYCDIYAGDGRTAWRSVNQAWPALVRANLLRFSITRADALKLRARAGLAAALDAGSDMPAILRSCEHDARVLTREPRPDAVADAMLIQAGVAAARGQRDRSLEVLEQAIARYDEAGMKLQAASSRRRQGQLFGDDGGRKLMPVADDFMRRQGVRDPDRWLAVHAPGFA